jgi:hypothetical protein
LPTSGCGLVLQPYAGVGFIPQSWIYEFSYKSVKSGRRKVRLKSKDLRPNSQGVRSVNKFRKSQTRKFVDILYIIF